MITFRVHGEPQPWPKEQSRIVWPKGGGKPFIQHFHRDWQTRTNPITQQVEKHNHGFIEAWKKKVIAEGKTAFFDHEPFKRPTALVVRCRFYLTPSDSQKRCLPSIRPDVDNLAYLIHNVLEKVCYENDCQIVDEVNTKRWADGNNPPGVEITIGEANGAQETLDL